MIAVFPLEFGRKPRFETENDAEHWNRTPLGVREIDKKPRGVEPSVQFFRFNSESGSISALGKSVTHRSDRRDLSLQPEGESQELRLRSTIFSALSSQLRCFMRSELEKHRETETAQSSPCVFYSNILMTTDVLPSDMSASG